MIEQYREYVRVQNLLFLLKQRKLGLFQNRENSNQT